MKNEINQTPLSNNFYNYQKTLPFWRLYRYRWAFTPKFVESVVKRQGITRDDFVFDPFSGVGTVPLMCFMRSIPSAGADLFPVADFVASSLSEFFQLKPGELSDSWESLQQTSPDVEVCPIAEEEFMKDAFGKNLPILRKMRTAIQEQREHRKIFTVLFFSILEQCSHFITDMGLGCLRRKTGGISEPRFAMETKVAEAEKDVLDVMDKNLDRSKFPKFYFADARKPPKIKPTHIITSPPYLGRNFYTDLCRFELNFDFVKNFEERMKIRDSLLGAPSGEPLHPALKEISTWGADINWKNSITGYFNNMDSIIGGWYDAFDECRLVLFAHSPVSGVNMVPTDLILSDIAEKKGFEVEEIVTVQQRLDDFPWGKQSVLFWKK